MFQLLQDETIKPLFAMTVFSTAKPIYLTNREEDPLEAVLQNHPEYAHKLRYCAFCTYKGAKTNFDMVTRN